MDALSTRPNMTLAIRGIGDFVIVRIDAEPMPWSSQFYHLRRKGGLFPLASGPIGFIRKHFEEVTRDRA